MRDQIGGGEGVNPLKRGLEYFLDLRGDLAKEGAMFLRWGWSSDPMHTMS